MTLAATDGDAQQPLTTQTTIVVQVIDLNDLEVTGFYVEDSTAVQQLAWNVDAERMHGSNWTNMYDNVPIDWQASHGSMETVFSTPGGMRVVITGKNMGMTSERLQRENIKDESMYTVTFGPVLGTKYTASGCVIKTPGSSIVCTVPAGVGIDHIWVVNANNPRSGVPHVGTSGAKTGFAPPKIKSVSVPNAKHAVIQWSPDSSGVALWTNWNRAHGCKLPRNG